jgi:hypothetical protein
MVNIGQDQLKRAAFCPQNKVDVLDVAVQVFSQAPLHQQHEANDAHTECEQEHAQSRLQGPIQNVAAGKASGLHAVVGFEANSTRSVKWSLRR